MPVKPSSPLKRFRVQFSIELEAENREAALTKAQEIARGNPNAKLKIQEAYLAWQTVVTPQAAEEKVA
jgi:hypothetical protein